MYRLTAKTTEYKPGDSIVRRHDAWNLEGEVPSDLDEVLSALGLMGLIPPSLARPIAHNVFADRLLEAASRFSEFYGVDNLIMDLTTGGHGSLRLTVEIPPMVSVYTFESTDGDEAS